MAWISVGLTSTLTPGFAHLPAAASSLDLPFSSQNNGDFMALDYSEKRNFFRMN
ncbi:MAG: hypothetical protein QG652_1777, partial [Pseudomonadota bacterium]|nr:hypothetical protein [Pseudomonadota bacterium]